MEPSRHVQVRIDLNRVRQNAVQIARTTGVPIIAVVKADAYGLGASRVADAIGDLVDGFYVFDAAEAMAARLFERTGKRTIALHGESQNPSDYIAAKIQPVVWSVAHATAMHTASPVLCVDTGQQRFAALATEADAVGRAGDCQEVMTHAIRLPQVESFCQIVKSWPNHATLFLHAAGSALLAEPAAWLHATRPGLALYRGSVRVSTRLVDAKDSTGPAGYTGFTARRFGVILAGYRHGLKPGPCTVNGCRQKILEVGMQSAFVELESGDHIGDEVVLLDAEQITLADISPVWAVSQQEVLVRLCGCGARSYLPVG